MSSIFILQSAVTSISLIVIKSYKLDFLINCQNSINPPQDWHLNCKNLIWGKNIKCNLEKKIKTDLIGPYFQS